jgi:hypothetical protein
MTEFIDDGRAGWLYRGIKMLDIGYTGFLYFLIGAGLMVGINMAIPNPDPNIKTGPLVGEILGLALILPIVSYITRNIVQAIGSPFNKVMGLRHNRLYETATGGVILSFALITTYTALVERVALLQKRLNAYKQSKKVNKN